MLPRSRTLPSRIHHGAVEERHDFRHYLQVEVQPKTQGAEAEAKNPQSNYSKCFDEDGRLKRTGTFWTTTAHIITAVIGSGVLSLAWAIGQLGWVAGPVVMILFALVNHVYTSGLLAQCYRSGDQGTGQRNYTYMDAVKANMDEGYRPCEIAGRKKVMLCGLIQYINLFGIAIGYTIAASVSMIIKRTTNMCMKHENGNFKGSLLGIIGTVTLAGTVTATQKMWRSLQALGAIAFAYSFSIILIEIQDTIRSPPAEHKTMKKPTLFSIAVTTVFYMLCGAMGHAAFGDEAPGNLLTGFGFYNPYWLLDIANVAIGVHLVGAYQVFCQPSFAFIEKWSARKWAKSNFVTAEYDIPIPFFCIYQLNFFRLIWRTIFVILTTLISMLMPFFNDVVGILGAFGFWPLTVFFPIEMYISQKKIARWTSRWIGLQMISMTCLCISIVAAVGSFAGVVLDLKTYKPFKTSY
ncbi:hypothetical protein I3760_05G082800 [Carya illinoinensis]|nr:hypothetical protein I3760_05G082800 [Carya illinoinensis]